MVWFRFATYSQNKTNNNISTFTVTHTKLSFSYATFSADTAYGNEKCVQTEKQ